MQKENKPKNQNQKEKNKSCSCGCEEDTEKHTYNENHCDDKCGCQNGKECTCDDNCTDESSGLKEQVDDKYLNLAKQIQADFENYRKRSFEEIKNAKIDGMIDAVLKFLPALDSLTKASEMIKDKNVLTGINMIVKEFNKSLSDLGIEKIITKGLPFNPNIANVVAVVSDNSVEDNFVCEEFQTGYKYKNKIVRYAQVIVNKN